MFNDRLRSLSGRHLRRPDADFDIIWLWLNPVLRLGFSSINPQAITWNRYRYDADD
jgi:hypothetical protein